MLSLHPSKTQYTLNKVMKLPKKIEPDRIVDSIIEVKFTSDFPYEIYLGQIYQCIDNTYNYTNRPAFGNQNIHIPNDLPRELKLSIGPAVSLFYNDKIKFEIQPGSVIFNCLDKYITWELYFPEIVKVIQQIHSSKCILSYNRIGLRYISEYPETDIKLITKFNFSFGMPDVYSDSFSFRTEYKKDNYRIIMNLSSKIPAVNAELPRRTISLIDIDVISENFEMVDLSALSNLIDEVHTVEKETFFSLLQDDFISSLNPEF